MTPTPSPEFVRQLFLYDPLLRVRWAVRTDMWIIERKMDERHYQLIRERPNPWKSPKGFDAFDGWKEGYVHVLTVHPTLLDTRVFDVLAEADTWRHGGMEKFNDRLDALEAAEEASVDHNIMNWNQSASREAFDRLQWGLGNRIAVTNPEPELRDTGLGFKVRDRRGAY